MDRALIICTPGLEEFTLRELRAVWPRLLAPNAQPQVDPFPAVQKLKGGLEIPCDLFRAVQLNFFLKTATRILWRLSQFKARDFPKLYQNLQKIPWAQWVGAGAHPVTLHVAAARSRLNHEGRITEVARSLLPKAPAADEFSFGVYIRVFDDQVSVSLDLSGETLHKRILNKKVGEAPFRETWAHFLLGRWLDGASVTEATLVDPFMGSGTFLTEALSFHSPNFRRPFAFTNLVRAPKLFKSPAFAGNYKISPTPLFGRYLGRDQNPEMAQVANENWLRTQEIFALPDADVSFENANATAEVKEVPGPIWLITNPPWGGRLQQGQSYESLLKDLTRMWKPDRLAMVLPRRTLNPLVIREEYRSLEPMPLHFGGQDLDFWRFEALRPAGSRG